MIRVRKPDTVPEVLATTGVRKAEELKAAHVAGDRAIKVKSDTYNNDEVKAALKAAQHDKCCYCESKVPHIAHGDVEHFRPKNSFRQCYSDDRSPSGYYWLAYDWNNLYFSCQICNQTYKNDLFPLDNPGGRCADHLGDISLEMPLLIDPGRDDPQAHIGFRDEYPFPRDRKGEVTIGIIGLDRESLNEERRKLLSLVRRLKEVAELPYRQLEEKLPPEDYERLRRSCEDARAELPAYASDSSQFAAMVQAALSAAMEEDELAVAEG